MIPLAAFKPHAVNVNTFLGSGHFLFVNDVMQDFEIHVHSVDGDLLLSGVVLQCASEEAVSEEELIDPEVAGDLCVLPGFKELQSLLQIFDVASEGLQRRVGFSHPHNWHLAVKHVEKSRFK